MKRLDRLAGLAVLSEVLGFGIDEAVGTPTDLHGWLIGHEIHVRGPEAVADDRPLHTITVCSSAAEGSWELSREGGARWVLWPVSGLRRRLPGGPGNGAVDRHVFAVVDEAQSPAYLVAADSPAALRWFAQCLRRTWGLRSRAARRLGRYAPLAPWSFPAMAALATPSAPSWPLAPLPGDPAPGVIHLGGGGSAGRCVLTYFGDRGAPLRHVKIDPASGEETCSARREVEALQILAGCEQLRGHVPSPLGFSEGSGWYAAAQSHLDGIPMSSLITNVDSWRRALKLVTTWLTDVLGHLSPANFMPLTSVAALQPSRAELPTSNQWPRERIDVGDRLARAHPVALHGDFWAGNLLVQHGNLRVFDWESAGSGHPLLDIVHFLVTSAQVVLGAGTTHSDAASAALAVDGLLSDEGAAAIEAVVSERLGRRAGGEETEALVLSAVCAIGAQEAPGGLPDPWRRNAWNETVSRLWQDWRRDGSPWRP